MGNSVILNNIQIKTLEFVGIHAICCQYFIKNGGKGGGYTKVAWKVNIHILLDCKIAISTEYLPTKMDEYKVKWVSVR